jgi:hypothetical protein
VTRGSDFGRVFGRQFLEPRGIDLVVQMQIYLDADLCLPHNCVEGEKHLDMYPKVGCIDFPILQLVGRSQNVA